MNWIETKQFLDNVAEGLFKKYIGKVDKVGFDFQDNESLAAVMPEAKTFLFTDNTDSWDKDFTYHIDTGYGGVTRLVSRKEFEGNFSKNTEVTALIDKLLQKNNIAIPKESEEYKRFCRQTLEMLYRLDERKASYKKSLISGIEEKIQTQQVSMPSPALPSLTLQGLIEKYCENKISVEKKWNNPVTIRGYKENLNRVIDIFHVIMGRGDFPITSLTKEHSREVRRILSLIPSNLKKKYSDVPAQEIIQKCAQGQLVIPEADRLMASTFNTYANLISGMFSFAHAEEFVEKNYFENLRIAKQIKKSRGAFTDSELERFFNTNLFLKKACETKWAWRYWVPIIMLYSGSRVEEICQLQLNDIYEVKDVLCFHIRSIEDQKTKEKLTNIKNQQSDRIVPVHPILKKIGLINYINSLKNKSESQLFPTLTNKNSKGDAKKYHATISKWFNENDEKHHKSSYIRKCGITDTSKVLYCFRHTVETFLINFEPQIEHDKIDAIMGHKITSTGRKHYGSYDPTTLLRVVSQLDFPKANLPWDTNKEYVNIPLFMS